ncbi:molybdopterin oxidoreductase [Actinorhabdospora filicis]|uniref:Molybdopterin oxidoreductase n=1 Tax=Actinorhabdospora filicis TaxID=1785913 RepID=A0A9W6SVF4_9ACTN|nr:molybdopterin oxidoreductase family protein [Actinorhabdospora filicis]GLZ81476.1 molybdopterin oxidoreductase [Actinorhabdospora filicis]
MGVPTHCPYCALQCGMSLEPGPAVAARSFPVNEGALCRKGWSATALLDHPERLRTPTVDGRASTWDEALDAVAARLLAIRAEHGPDAVAVFGGGGLTNEKAYLLGKFARVALGTAQIDYNGRFCMSSAAAAGLRAFGVDRGLPFPVTDLAAADAVMLVGANVAETMPPLVRHLRRARDRGGLITVDPRDSATAELAALRLRPRPGTDLALALGMLHIAVAEGHADKSYLDARTTGFAEVWRVAAGWWPERAEAVTGVAAADLRAAVEILAGAERAYLLTGRGTEQHATGVDQVTGWINLALSLGLPGREGSGYGCLTGQGNGQGGREHGQKADQLPGYRSITDPAARAHVAGVWGVPAESLPGPGRSAFELLDALGEPGGPRALIVFGSNPAVSAPDSARIHRRLSALDLLVVADLVPSETARLAHVVLPVPQWAEEDGTMTNLEGRVLLRRRAYPAPPGTMGDLRILRELAVRLGQPAERFPDEPEEVFAELRRASAGGLADYSGVTYERLRAGEALHWPCPDAAHPGTPRLFLDGFAHPGGRARMRPAEHTGPAEALTPDRPLWLTTGRVLAQYQSGAQTRRVPELATEMRVEVHPDTAARAGLADGDLARVVSARGAFTARVHCTTGIRADTLFAPFHFPGEQRANLATHPALDPVSRMPEFKVAAVRLERP